MRKNGENFHFPSFSALLRLMAESSRLLFTGIIPCYCYLPVSTVALSYSTPYFLVLSPCFFSFFLLFFQFSCPLLLISLFLSYFFLLRLVCTFLPSFLYFLSAFLPSFAHLAVPSSPVPISGLCDDITDGSNRQTIRTDTADEIVSSRGHTLQVRDVFQNTLSV